MKESKECMCVPQCMFKLHFCRYVVVWKKVDSKAYIYVDIWNSNK